MADMSEFTVGALVRWSSGPGSPTGVITGVDWPRITVRFDGGTDEQTFNAKTGVIARVPLGGIVRRLSTNAIGFIEGPASGDTPRWKVVIDGSRVTVAEADLRPHVLDDPSSRMAEGRLGTPQQFNLAVTARRYAVEHMGADLVSLTDSRVAAKPHQVSVVHRVVTGYPHRFLLCDEVGLGKTIEAGMVLKELRARGAADRVIIIVPPNLQRQWQYELKTKFNETFSIMNSATVDHLRREQHDYGNPFLAYDRVIVSNRWIARKKWADLASEVDWDMVIVDEAHHARVRRNGSRRDKTELYKVVRDLVSPETFSKRAALFLTATPMQLDASELYSLVELLDPALFPTEEHFNQHRAAVPGLSRLVHDLRINGYDPEADVDELQVHAIAHWIDADPGSVRDRLASGPDGIDVLCDELSARHLLSEVLIRNRKKSVGGFMPRQAHRWEVDLTPEEQAALAQVEAYVANGYAQAEMTENRAVGFVMVIFQKLMASSTRALKVSLDRRRQRLEATAAKPGAKTTGSALDAYEDRLEDEDYASEVLAEIAAKSADEAAELARLVELLDALPTDSKADALVLQLDELRRHEPDAKVLLFTEFRETQEYLRERLRQAGWEVHLFHGQLDHEAKDASVEAFRAATEPCVLLSTEAGGEGRNLQFCHLLVNYDLPWNPMRVEQRIGRVDRIGQDQVVQVFNLWVKGTVEERVLDVLEHRIRIFEETVGGLDPILGDTEKSMKNIFKAAGEERERALAKFEQDIERNVARARDAEEQFSDFIMETKSYRREIATLLGDQTPTISPSAHEHFVMRLLADVRTYLDRNDDGTFDLTFREPFVSDFPEHSGKGARKRVVALRSDVRPDSEHVEFMTFSHPVINDLVTRATNPSYVGSVTAFEVMSGTTEPTSGWMVVHELEVPALDSVREITATFVDDGGTRRPDVAAFLWERCPSFPTDRPIPFGGFEIGSLDLAVEISEKSASERLHELERQAHDSSRIRYERDLRKLETYFDYARQFARDALESQERKIAEMERDPEEERRKILPAWQAKAEKTRILLEQLDVERESRIGDLARRIETSGSSEIVAIARVTITRPRAVPPTS